MEKRIVILGAGESGVGAALLAKEKGYDVFVSDRSAISNSSKEIFGAHNILFEEGKHTKAHILNADVIVKSPGIPNTVEIIQQAKERGINVIAEIEFAAQFTKARFIGITGTNGKTTTALLTYHLLKEAGLNVGLAGNVGSSLAKQVIKDEFDYYVLELSSFQLDDMFDFKPDIAVMLNITPDHLDRYDNSIQKYAESKFRLTRNMDLGTKLIYFAEDQIIAEHLKTVGEGVDLLPISINNEVNKGAFLAESQLEFKLNAKDREAISIPLALSPLKGIHNAINLMAAVLVAFAFNIETDKVESAIQSFKNAPHRLEKVANIKGVSFVNDSKATNVDAVYYALEGFKEPLVWIAGGIDKGNNYEQIEMLVKQHVKALVCLGKDNTKISSFFKSIIPIEEETETMAGAVSKAFALATEGDVVLLSPACASFDLFKNYEDRGNQFRKAVKILEDGMAEGRL